MRTSQEDDATRPDRTIDRALRELLVCPVDHAQLKDVERTLVCVACGRTYPVEDGIPDMTVAPVD